MSDSSKKTVENFNSKLFAKDLSGKGNYGVIFDQVNFQVGWAPIYEEFIQAIKNYTVLIRSADDYFNFLDIEIDVGKSTSRKFKDVYTAILKAKNHSLCTCAYCGDLKHATKGRMYCNGCRPMLVKLNKTGTWLDHF